MFIDKNGYTKMSMERDGSCKEIDSLSPKFDLNIMKTGSQKSSSKEGVWGRGCDLILRWRKMSSENSPSENSPSGGVWGRGYETRMPTLDHDHSFDSILYLLSL